VTLRNRVSVAAAVGVLVVVAAVSSVLYFAYAASLHSRVDAALVDAAQQASSIAKSIKQSARQSAGGSQSTPDITEPVTVGSVQVQLFPDPAAGRPTPFGPLDSRDVAVAEGGQPAYFISARDGGKQFRVYTAVFPAAPGGGLVRTSRAANADDGALRNAALLLAGLTIAATGITYGAARLSAGRILRPIAELTAAAEHVTQTRDLSARLDSTGTDEVGRLGSSFDTMLAALHESVTAQRQLVADASHELRTPLTSLTTNLDLLEDGAGLADPQAPALVQAAREQAGELDQLITDLLDLARYGESTPHRETVRLDLLTSEAVHRTRQRTPHSAIDTDLHPCLVHVDPAGVDHAICNLIDNAIKWDSSDGAVHVAVEDGRVSVTDHGPGIPDEDLPHIFERFYRAPAARGMPGAGLGLAIVARIARANHATADVRTGPEGSTFTLAFPPPPRAAELVQDERDRRVGVGAQKRPGNPRRTTITRVTP
jgi:signal transduction histidine kinase